MLTFDAPTHSYRWHGMLLPHVTGVLRHEVDYSRVSRDAMMTAREEGKAIHKMVELYLTGRLDYLPPWLGQRLKALQKFHRESRFTFVSSEQIVHHPANRYAGTLDLCVNMHDRRAVIDVKRSLLAGDVIGLQIAAYAAALDFDTRTRSDRYALVLKTNGDYELEPYEDASDYSAFLAALAMHNWRIKHSRTQAEVSEYDTV